MASTESTRPRGGFLSSWSHPSVKKVTWDIYHFRCEIMEKLRSSSSFRSELQSDDFHFAGATWNLFAAYSYSSDCDFKLGINVQNSTNAVFACCCSISCEDIYGKLIKKMESNFICESDELHSKTLNSFPRDERLKFLEHGAFIVCEISIKKLTVKKAISQAEISHSSRSRDVEPPTPIQVLENEEEAVFTTSIDKKVCEDFKNLLLSEEFSDVTIKIGDQQFKAHWSILAARSPVFASMLRHDTKEKATGIVDVEDCELSSFPVFLEYVYSGRTEKISSENVFNLYVSADKYDVQDLKRICLEFMMTNLLVDTFCETLRLCLQHSEKKLLKLATEFFINNFRQIILTPKWQAFIVEYPIEGNELFIKATNI